MSAKREKKSIWNAPNIITLGRLFIVPVVAALLYPWGDREEPGRLAAFIAAVLFILAFVGDWVDGYLARRNAQITTFGKLIDPLADKVLVLVVLIMMIPINWVPLWAVLVLLVRELAITGLRSVAAEEGLVIHASQLGKWKTAYQAVSISGLILHYRPSEYLNRPVPAVIDWNFAGMGEALFYIAVLIGVWSGVDYMVKFWHQLLGSAAGSGRA